jgi:beta-glucosidase-like glycosyl hydrolase
LPRSPLNQKKRRIITVVEAIEETPSSASAPKTAAAEAAPAEASTSEAAAAEATNLKNTLSDIDEMILNMAEKETAAAAEETPAVVPKKGRRCLEKRRSLPKMLRKKEISTFKS